MNTQGTPPLSLEEARARLRALGYLDGGVERFLFRRAFEGRGGLFLPAVLLGAFSAAVASLAAVETAEPGFRGSLAAAGVLLLHLFLANLVPAALLGGALGFLADRSRSPGGAAAAFGLAAAIALFILWIAGAYGLSKEWDLFGLLWGVPVVFSALLLATSVRGGYLARAYAHSRALPRRPRKRALLGAAAVALSLAAAFFALPRRKEDVPSPQPSPRSERLVVAAVDGLALDSPEGAGQTLRARLRRGATGWWPAKRGSPPEIWMDLATGVPSSRHGVRALARVRPDGSPLALAPPRGTGWYLRRAGPALGLVSSAPVSSSDRESLTFWEVAASSGLASLAVGWWASGDWPGAVVHDNRTLLTGVAGGLEADRKARLLFQEGEGRPVATVYFPGADILRHDAPRRTAALSALEEFLVGEIERAERRETVLVVLAADSHPSPGALARMIVFDGAPAMDVRIRAVDVAPSLLARAGIPVAEDLPGRPVSLLFRENTLEKATVATYGPRIAPRQEPPQRSDREYLEKLKSLGYLD